jgi:hypothetical protein
MDTINQRAAADLSASDRERNNLAAQAKPTLTMVVSMSGHLTEGAGEVIFPGEGVVDAATILEQPEVFGPDVAGSESSALTSVMSTTSNAPVSNRPITMADVAEFRDDAHREDYKDRLTEVISRAMEKDKDLRDEAIRAGRVALDEMSDRDLINLGLES